MTITDQAYVEVTLTDVRRIQPNDKYSLARNVLQLREIGGTQRVLGIWVGAFESEAILILSADIQTVRPLTYAFAARLLQATGAEVSEVRISKLAAETFFAESVIRSKDGHESVIDSRPSDAIALALQSHAPIRVAEEVMREASRPAHIIPPADGEQVLDRAALLAEMERIRLQRDAETEMINAEIRARRAAEALSKTLLTFDSTQRRTLSRETNQRVGRSDVGGPNRTIPPNAGLKKPSPIQRISATAASSTRERCRRAEVTHVAVYPRLPGA